MQASGYLKRRAMQQHNYWKKTAKKLNIKKSFTSVWLLVYFVSSMYRYICCDETMLLSITWFQTRGTRKFDERSGGTSAYKS